jgi:hypothetical protein
MASSVGRGIALPFLVRGIRRGEWSVARPNRTLIPGKTRYPLYRRLGGPKGQSGRAENLAPPGFDSRTFQPVVSLYTNWATWPTFITVPCRILVRMRCVQGRIWRPNQTTNFMLNKSFRKSCRLLDNMERYGKAEPATDDYIKRYTRCACRISKATNSHP